jgi:hypothetical protein
MLHPPHTNVKVRVDGQLLVHQSVFLLVARFPIHNVTFRFLIGQGNGGDLEKERPP